MTQWLLLLGAIFSEVIATSALKAANGFTRLWPSLLVAAGYGVAFFLLSLTLRTMPLGIAYAVWSGIGTALVTLAGWMLYGQRLDAPALVGIALIISGVVILNASSRSIAH